MVSVKLLIRAAAATLISSAAYAADLPQRPIAYQPQPAVVETPASGWYLRGDVGVGVQTFSEFDHDQTNANSSTSALHLSPTSQSP